MKEKIEKISFATPYQAIPDYSSILDEDIKILFNNKNYLSFEPLLAQITKELKKYNEIIRKNNNA